MANDEILLRLKLLDEFSATLKKYQSEPKGAETASAQVGGRITTTFSNVSGAMKALAGAAATGAVIQALRGMVNAAAEAEQAQMKLVAAMKATNNFTDSAVRGVEQWSQAFLQATGISDELAKSLHC